SGTMLDPNNLISDFDDIAAATVVQAGTPPRNGYWYPYNDDSPGGTDPTCVQKPISGPQAMAMGVANPTYVGDVPATLHAGAAATDTLALHAVWSGCGVWGAGVGADLNQPAAADGGTYNGPKVPYDVTAYKGVTFWAMAAMGSDTGLRMKFPMTDETKIVDGGNCDEAVVGMNKCSDDFGEALNLPSNGTWKQFTIKFSDSSFKQEGWGAPFSWNPMHVTSIQIQSSHMGEPYDFWIDDLYFTTQ
ncbi:MAG TPA: hypothetical protein VIF57_09385, partial [Polyangia bacterium]